MQSQPRILAADDRGSAVRAFLIADIRGYSTFTRERGHADAAKLAAKFVDLATDAIEANGGRVVEIRGDEVLAVFGSPLPAARAGVELQLACSEESARDPDLIVPAGVGIDTGESVRSGEQYHGSALNMAARLCSKARAGEVLVTRGVANPCAQAADLRLEERGTDQFKGFDAPVDVIAVAAARGVASAPLWASTEMAPLPPALDPLTPMVGRNRELHWLRGTWRAARRGAGRVVFVSGTSQIGKTRLAAALASEVQRMGGDVRYSGPGGTAAADALVAIRDVLQASEPALLVLDDLDTTGPAPLSALAEASATIAASPAMVVCLVQDRDRTPQLAGLVSTVDGDGNGHRILTALGAEGVQEIARMYAGSDLAAVPVESVVRASAGVPGRIHEVMSDWARQETSRRLTAAAEYLAAGQTRRSADLEFANNVIGLKLGQLYSVEPMGEPTTELCPYKGLASFQGADAATFFGRERLVGELAARTVQFGLLGVVGDSGSGKSSVIAAGLLPSLRAGLLPGSERWQQLSMRPGEHPMAELLATSRILVPDAGTDAFEQAARSVGAEGRLVLFVDQFEELFTICRDESERTSFIESLTAAARSPDRFCAVLAIRGDFYGSCARYPEFAALLAANHVPIGPMTPDELHRAIELPARRVGLRAESSLVDELLEDVADQPGGLPLLSTALVELWQHRENGWLRHDTYRRTDGLRGAVARLADATHEQLSESEQETARRIFLRLVGPGEGEAVTRRRAPISEFDLDRDEVARQVLERFTNDRLLTTSASTVEVAHEALLREWPRLQHWIAEDLQGHQLRQHLAQVARQWEASERETSELYRGARLSATLDWSAAHGQDLNELEREFVQESRQAGEQENRRIRRTNRRLRGLLVGAAALLVVALIAGSVAFIQRGNARRSASAAEHSATVALSQSLGAKAIAEPRLDVAMLLAAQAVKLDDSVETQSDLLATLERSPWTTAIIPLEGEGTQAMKVAIGPDSKELAVTDDKGNLYFYDLATRQRIGEPLAGFAAYGDSDMVFTPDGSLLIAQNAAGTPKLIDRATHQVVKDFKRIRAGTQGLVLSPDGRIAYSGAEGSVARWDLVAQRRLPSVHISDTFNSIPVLASSTGEVITATHDRGGLVQVRDGTTLAVKRSFPVALPPDNFITVAVSPDGMVAAVCTNSGEDKSLTFVDLRTGALHKGTGGLSGGGFAFSPDGRTLVANSTISVSNNVIYVWDVASHTAVASLPGHEGAINDLKFDAAGHSVYATGADGTITVYDFTGAGRFGRPLSVGSGNPTDYPCCIPGFAYFSASPDGNTVATTQAAGIVNIVEVATGDTISSFQAIPDGYSVGTAYAPDGSVVAVTGEPGIVALWRLDEGQPRQVRTLRGLPQVRTVGLLGGAYHFTPTPLAVFSPDGRWVAATEGVQILDKGNPVGFRVTVAEWDASSGAQRAPSVEFPAESYSGNVVFSPDGRLVATAVDNDVLLLDATTLKVVRRFTSDPEGIAWLAFSPKGTYLATAGWSGDVHLWRVATWKQIGTGVRVVSGNLHNIEFDPTEQRVLITASGGLSGLWTVPNLRRIGGAELPHGPILSYSWSLSTFAGSSAVLVYANGEAYSWPAEVGGWVRRACEVAGRNLTQEEWRFYLQDRPYQKTCPDA